MGNDDNANKEEKISKEEKLSQQLKAKLIGAKANLTAFLLKIKKEGKETDTNRRKKRVVQISNTRCQSCGNNQCTLNNHEDYNTTIVKRNQTCWFHGNRRNYFQEGLGQCTRCLQTSNIEKTSVRCDRGFKERE